MDFGDWLQEELKNRHWSHAELARRSGVQTAQISRVIAGKRGAGPDLCIAIAKGLDLPRLEVFQARGWLPSYLDDPYGYEIDPRAERLAREISKLPLESREITLRAIEPVLEASRQFTDQIQELSANGHEHEN